MNQEALENKWNEVRAAVKAQWDQLTDDEIDAVRGRKTELQGILQKRYGWQKDRARQEVIEFWKKLIN